MKKIKKLRLYLVEFDKNGIIKNKIYLLDYVINSKDYYLVIVIIYNEYIFLQISIFAKFKKKLEIFFYILNITDKVL